MSNPAMETKVRELMELKRMREELDAEIASAEDAMQMFGRTVIYTDVTSVTAENVQYAFLSYPPANPCHFWRGFCVEESSVCSL